MLLAVLRIGQGIALGGSWDGLPSLLALNAPQNRRGWYAMLGQLGAPIGFIIAGGLFCLPATRACRHEDFLDWGWRYPFYVAFAINVVALFARLRLVATNEYAHLLDERELRADRASSNWSRAQGRNVVIGAFAALASYALFHLVTVFPLSWITLYSHAVDQRLPGGADRRRRAGRRRHRRLRPDRRPLRPPQHAGHAGGADRRVQRLRADAAGRRRVGQDVFILVGFVLLGLSYGQAAGAVTRTSRRSYRYTGAALTSDLAWLVGAAFAPLVALGLSAHFGLAT